MVVAYTIYITVAFTDFAPRTWTFSMQRHVLVLPEKSSGFFNKILEFLNPVF
jgi:hypothetical protein